MGRLLGIDSPDSGTASYTYDPSSNLIKKTDARGITTTYTYDTLNRLTIIHFPDQDVTYTYDNGNYSIGRLSSISDASGITTYQYNINGYITQKETTISEHTYTTTYTYDKDGNQTSITYPDGRKITYTIYAGRTAKIEDTENTYMEDITYLPFGPPISYRQGDGTTTNIAFNQDYQITSINIPSILSRTYTHDNRGYITSITDNINQSKNQTFAYDPAGRLIHASGIYGNITYTI